MTRQYGAEATNALLPGKASKHQVTSNRTPNRHRWFFFFKQKTAYEIMSGDRSSDVCSSDLTGLFYNITELVPEVNDDIVSFYPAVIDDFGDAKIVSIDNLESAIFYHRLTSKQTTLRDTQYGSSNKEVIDTYSLSLYVIGNRKKLKENAADTSLRVTSMIPDTFLQDGKQVA